MREKLFYLILKISRVVNIRILLVEYELMTLPEEIQLIKQ